MDLRFLRFKYEAAADKARREPTLENREAAQRAWAEYDAAAPRIKRARYGSRAGKRQQQLRGK